MPFVVHAEALAVSTDVTIVTLPARSGVNLALTPSGKVELKREGTLTKVKVEIDKVPLWTSVGPYYYCYTLWAISPEGAFENLGELGLDGTNARLETSSHFDQLAIIVTAEPHYMVDRPSAHVVYRNQPPRNANIRRLNLPIEVGTYDYSSIALPPEPGTPNIIFQARAAFQIAENAGAAKWAEPDLRLARVARDTMDEMIRRTAPLEIVSTIANETVRRSQRALIASRERAIILALEDVEKEVAQLSEEKHRLETRVREVTDELNAATNQIRNLNNQVTTAGRTNAQLTQQREEAETNLRNASRELTQLKRQQEELQKKLSLRLRPEHFDENGLTPAGRDALARICGIADVVPGPITLEGFPSDLAFQAVMLYMVEAGVPHDRIITRR